MVGITVTVNQEIKYLFYEKHRGKATNSISVWDANFTDELSCFKECVNRQWIFENNGWGHIKISDDEYMVLGHNSFNPVLRFAKFVGDNTGLWHGYPADFKQKPNDKPKNVILLRWLNEKFISKHVYRKIQQGQI